MSDVRRARQAAPLLVHWLPVLVWMVLILTLSGRSDLGRRTNPATGEVTGNSYTVAKIAHFVEYGVLAALLLRATTAPGGGLAVPPGRAAIWVVVASTAFGAGDELRQSFVPTREARLSDVLIDGVSETTAVAVLVLWRRTKDAQRLDQRGS